MAQEANKDKRLFSGNETNRFAEKVGRGVTTEIACADGYRVVIERRGDARLIRLTTDFREHLTELYRRYGYDVNAKRLKEIELVIAARHGGPVDTDDGPAYLSYALNARALSWRHRRWPLRPATLIAWARKWTPRVPIEDVRRLANAIWASPRPIRGVTVGKGLCLDTDEADALGITTITPRDADPAKLAESRKAADKARKATERKRSGATPQADGLRALCRSFGLTESNRRQLGRLRGRIGDIEDYLTRHGVDIGACPQFVRLLDSRNRIELEDQSNRPDELGTSEPGQVADASLCSRPAREPERASSDHKSAGGAVARASSANQAVGRSGETFGGPERNCPSAGPAEPTQANQREDIELTETTADTTEPNEPAPTGAPVRSRRDWLVEVQKVNRQLVEPDLDDADRIVLEDERAELIAGLRAAFPAQEQAQAGKSAALGRDTGQRRTRAAASSPELVTQDRPTTFSAPSFRRVRA